jgi:hypothetical protein
MKLNIVLPLLALTAFVSAQSMTDTPLPKYKSLNDYLVKINEAALKLEEVLKVAADDLNLDTAKMPTDEPIFALVIYIGDANEALDKKTTAIDDYGKVFASMETLEKHTESIARSIIKIKVSSGGTVRG